VTDEPLRLPSFPAEQVLPTAQLVGRGSELDLLAQLGDPTSTWVHADERWFSWDLQWPCGLVTSVELAQLSEELRVHLDEPEVAHALRHLGISPDVERSEGAPADWVVVEEDRTSGDATVVAEGLAERDARCLAGELGPAPADRRIVSEGLPPVPVGGTIRRAERRSTT
jgi:hypothetical protein